MDLHDKMTALTEKMSERPIKKNLKPSELPLAEAPGYTLDDPDRATVKTHIRAGDCEMCGFPAGVPGHLKDSAAANGLTPCPKCYNKHMTARQRMTGQLEGVLSFKTFDTFLPLEGSREAYTAVREWVSHPTGWCTLWGSYGPGKTHLAAAVANHLGKDQALYFNFPDFTSMLRNDTAGAYRLIQRIKRVPVLILDELDSANLKNWTSEQVQMLISYRVRNEDDYGLMLCSNTSPDDWGEELAYVGSRMRSEGFICLEMTGDNRPVREQLEQLAKQGKF